jgi:type II secretory pathway pseudopilin PulG
MVALAVFAVVGLALTKNASLAVVQTTRMQEQMLASMVAQNVLRERLARGGEKDPFTRRTANSKRFRWLIGDTKSLLEVKPPTMMM